MKPTSGKKKSKGGSGKVPLERVFNPDEKTAMDELFTEKKKMKLTPLDYTEEELKNVDGPPQSDVPKKKDLLYKEPILWKIVEEFAVIEGNIKPWVSTYVEKYFGQAETELVEFIARMVNTQKPAQDIETELSSVFGEKDSEKFVSDLWTRLVEIPMDIKRGMTKPAKEKKPIKSSSKKRRTK